MTMWEFTCVLDGIRKSHGTKEQSQPMSDERAAELGIVGF